MKYYFPTTTLNFNNILSSESISPRAFYALRGFGYGRWNAIPANGPDECLLFYREAKGVSFADDGRDDHLLLVEVAMEKTLSPIADGAFSVDHTIYLNPANTRFIFASEMEREMTLAIARTRLETKLIRLYSGCFDVRNDLQGHYEAPVGLGDGVRVLNQSAIESDVRLNRLKGLLYGYYVGARLSTTSSHVELLNTYRELQNLFAAVASSPDKKLTPLQKERTVELFRTIRRHHPLVVELMSLVGQEKAVSVFELFQRYGFNGLPDERSAILASLQSDRAAEALSWIDGNVRSHLKKMERDAVPLSPEAAELVLEDRARPQVSSEVLTAEDDRALFNVWTRDVFQRTQFTGKISPEREGLADQLAMSAKDVLGDKWQNSSVRDALNKLRRFVRDEPVSLDWNNGVLASVAAVVVKGDNWEDLLRFMQGKGMTDYRLAFAFYGELNGFANLTRDFTDVLLNLSGDYVKSVYEEFYGQIHGETVSVCEPGLELDRRTELGHADESMPEGEYANSNGGKVPSAVAPLVAFFDNSTFKVNSRSYSKASLRNALMLAVSTLGGDATPQQLLDLLAKKYASYGWKKNNASWKKLRDFVGKSAAPSLPGMESSEVAKSVSSARPDKSSLRVNTLWIDQCAQMIQKEKSKKYFCEDVHWFLKNWEFGLESETASFDKSNAAVIGRLEKYLMGCRNPTKETLKWKAAIYALIPVEKIIGYLRNTYV